MLRRCGTCSGWGRTSGDGREAAHRASVADPGPDRVRPRPPARATPVRPGQGRKEAALPCSSASALAAVGSRSPRRVSRPSGCAGRGSRSRSCRSRRPAIAIARRPFGEIGSRGVFVKELEEALLAHRVDVAVHSAKDMTATDSEGLAVGAYLPREDPRDALCGTDTLEPGMRIGTASVRRRAQLLALEPGLSIEPHAREHRHAAAQARRARARRDRARRVRPRPARPRPRDLAALRARRAAARSGAGRAGAPGAGRRGGARGRRRRSRDPAPGDGGAALRLPDRRRLSRSGGGASTTGRC